MKIIQKGNKQLRVDDVRAAALLKTGYVEIDEKTGKPIQTETPDDKALKKENAALKKENKELKAQVAELTEKLEATTAAGKTE